MFLNAIQSAAHIGVGRTSFYALLKTDSTFPEGITLTSTRRVWDPVHLDAWRAARFAAAQKQAGKGRTK